MDSDATTLQNAVDLLRQRYGERLPGSQVDAEAQMRRTLEQQMGLDMLAADRVLKRLCLSGQLAYVDSAGTGTEAGTDAGTGAVDDSEANTTATGPVISMPLTQSADVGQPLITSASPAMLMGITNDTNQDGDIARAEDPNPDGDTLGWLVAPAIDEGPTPDTTGGNEDGGGRAQGYWRIG